jgi:hypothetical protein
LKSLFSGCEITNNFNNTKQKKASSFSEEAHIMMKKLLLGQLGGVFCQLGLQVAGFVLVDDTTLGQSVDDGVHLRQLGFGF